MHTPSVPVRHGLFTPAQRERLREELIAAASGDPRVTGVAVTGSAAGGTPDRWSDIDLALGVAPAADMGAVMADWTARMYRSHGAVHHLDVARGATVYRVFLLRDTLQVDIAFAPAAEFGAVGPTFRLVHGTAVGPRPAPARDPQELMGMCWLYALHVRSSILRGRPWQAEYMISAMRDHALALCCLRHGLPAQEARRVDCLPADAIAVAAGGLVRSLDAAELWRAFRAVTDALTIEVGHADPDLAKRLAGPLAMLNGDEARA